MKIKFWVAEPDEVTDNGEVTKPGEVVEHEIANVVDVSVSEQTDTANNFLANPLPNEGIWSIRGEVDDLCKKISYDDPAHEGGTSAILIFGKAQVLNDDGSVFLEVSV